MSEWKQGETIEVRWSPNDMPVSGDEIDHGPGPGHHGEYSHLIESKPHVTAQSLCETAASLVGGDRARTHGDKVENHQNIARLWTAYLHHKLQPGSELTALDAATLMELLKIARTQAGAHNADDYVDAVGYAAVRGEIAARER